MLLKRGSASLPSKEIRKGARLLAFLVSDEGFMSPACVISIEEMMRLRDSTQPMLTGRPAYVAVQPITERLFVYPAADKAYCVRQRWQLEYEVA